MALLLCTLALPLRAQAPLGPAAAEAWREDLRTLAAELPRRHPMLFEGLTPTRLTRAAFDSAVRDLDRRIPSLRRHEVVVGLQRIVAMAGAGHTSINAAFDPRLGFHAHPLRLQALADGIFVVAADGAHRGLVGARVRRIGSVSAEDALARVGAVLSHENEQFLRAHGMLYLVVPEVLHALGVAPEPERTELVVESGGRERTVVLRDPRPMRPAGHDGPGPVDETGWVEMRPAATAPPLWRSRAEPRWVEYLPASGTLYVAYQSSVPAHEGEAVPAFIARVLALADSVKPARLVLDVRDNTGGESFFNRQLVLGIVRRPWLDRRGAFFAVIGRRTYSAAQNLVNELERYTNVTFVGEPTGSPPAFFGDHDPLVLPRSGIRVNVSTLWWSAPMNPRDRRPFTAPRFFAEPASADLRAGRDPVLDSLDAWTRRPTLTAELTAALAAADTGEARRRFEAYRARAENRYADVEPEVNALGYALLRAGRGAEAVRLFELNVAAHPRSANAHDSLGEAFERLGQREDAVRMYRRALALDHRMGSSSDGLRRLGAAGEARGAEARHGS
jgi:hypothetical protein